MSRTVSVKTNSNKPRAPLPRVVGRPREGDRWRCPECTFLTEGDSCTMCQSPKPSQARTNTVLQPPPRPKIYKGNSQGAKPRVESLVYEDRTDNSVNVPIAGIKKYHYEPRSKPNTNKRNYVGLLQDAASDEPMPCMRKRPKK